MLPSTTLYAAKKRKKPVQKIPKLPPPDGAKSNPSKRHRDRLNGELDKLTNLLPFTEEVRARLDKLSVLRLSVGYLKVKSFFNAAMKNGSTWTTEQRHAYGKNVQNLPTPLSLASSSQVTSIDGYSFSEGELLLQALNGFVLVVTAEGYVFYTSPTIQDFLGFHQSDVVHQSVFELIHTDDRALFRRHLHFALDPNSTQLDNTAQSSSDQDSAEISYVMNYDPQSVPPENSSFLERNFCCRFRCLLDNSSGFLALNFRGRLKFLRGQNRVSEDGTLVPPQLALFSIATPMQLPSILEIRNKTLLFQTKHKLDFTPTGVDTRGKVVLGYSEAELCMRGSGYHFIHAADMMYCADNHIKMIKTGESGFTVFRLLTKSRTWVWVQANARLVFKGGRPDFIVARQRALTNEEGEEQLRLRRLQLPFNFATGEALLYETAPTVNIPDTCSAPKQRKLDNYSVSPNSMLGCMLRQDQSVYCEHNSANNFSTLNDVAFQDTHATVSVPGDAWQLPSPKPVVGNLLTAEETINDMVETLHHIIGDNDFTETLNVEPDELKCWESMLLKMSTTSCDPGEELNDILSEDILSFVEEQLQGVGELKLPDQLDDVPACLSTSLDLHNQNTNQKEEQKCGWIPNKGQMMTGQMTPGLKKLTPMDLSSTSGSPLQQLSEQAVGLSEMVPPATFNPALLDTHTQAHNHMSLQVSDNNLGVFRQTSQLFSHQTAQTSQNPLQIRMSNLHVGLQDHTGERHLNPMVSIQGNQLNACIQGDKFVETYNQNISAQPGFSAALPTCLQGQFALQTQNSKDQRLSWPLQQQHQQQLIPGGPQQMGACLNQMSGLQRNPVPGLVVPQNPIKNRSMFNTPEVSEAPFTVQQILEHPSMASSGSCMFSNATSSVPINSQRNNQPPSWQRMTITNPIQSSSSCLYQDRPVDRSMKGGVAITNPDEAALSCQITTGLDVNSLVNFHDQTQISNHPVVGNGDGPFSLLPGGNPFYSKKK
ncbi:aryl hydrocarbon receptor 2 [Betta splendens]|uniref:Aryl hydrocarbon receptor n=1 Tax=Betta splendens TaxID=158456 RepID=A0A6P7L990_BETSP|nr:aryl hydrocarbon receptor 2 [Betta splendens]